MLSNWSLAAVEEGQLEWICGNVGGMKRSLFSDIGYPAGLTLLGLVYLSISNVPPPTLNILGLGGVRVPILLKLLVVEWIAIFKRIHEVLMPRTLKINVWLFTSRGVFDPVCECPPYKILVFLTNFNFFRRKEKILLGQKCTALFQTHKWEKSSFF